MIKLLAKLLVLISISASQVFASSFLVANLNTTNQTGQLFRYDATTGAFQGNFISGGSPVRIFGFTFGPDGNLYLNDNTSKQILKYDGATGAYVGVFANVTNLSYRIEFGPDGNLYVGMSGGNIVRFNGVTGASLGTFIPAPGGGGVDFGGLTLRNGYVYVTYIGGTLYQYNAASGALVSNLYSGFTGNGPRGPRFGPDGNLYVPDWQTPRVTKFDGTTFAVTTNFINDGAISPTALEIGPDGNLLVLTDSFNSSVRRYNLQTGAFLNTLVAPGTGLDRTAGIKMMPEPPRLSVALVGPAQTRVTWETVLTNLVPEFSTNLSVSAWSPVTNAVTRVNDQFSFTVNAVAPKQFYRLRKP